MPPWLPWPLFDREGATGWRGGDRGLRGALKFVMNELRNGGGDLLLLWLLL